VRVLSLTFFCTSGHENATSGLSLGPHPCKPFALVASPRLRLRHCSCSTRVEKEEVAAIQEHKKQASKKNPRNSKLGKICCFQH